MRAMVRWARCSGRDSVCETESISQPKTVFMVSQEASPLLNFLRERFFGLGVLVRRLEEVVDCLKQDPTDRGQTVSGTLAESYEVVYKHLNVGQRNRPNSMSGGERGRRQRWL